MKDEIGPVTTAMLVKSLRVKTVSGKKVWEVPGPEVIRAASQRQALQALVTAARAEGAPRSVKRILNQAIVAQRVHDLIATGKSHIETAAEVGLDITRIGDLARWATSEPIEWTNEDELVAAIKIRREDLKHSWAGIAICSGLTIGKVQQLYSSKIGDPHKSDLGKGGRRKATYFAKAKPKPKAEPKPKVAKAPSTKPKTVQPKTVQPKTVQPKTVPSKKVVRKVVKPKVTSELTTDDAPF